MSSSKSLSALQPRRIGMRLFLGGLLVAASAAVVLPALAQGHHGGPGHAMMGPEGAGPMFGGSLRHMDRLLDSVAATDAQKAQIKQIADAARTDMVKQREAGRAVHDKLRQALTAATIDTNAVEQLRLQMLAQHDQTSRRGLQTMIDIAQVLTPEQRAKVGDQMAKAATMRQERMQRYQRDGAAAKS